MENPIPSYGLIIVMGNSLGPSSGSEIFDTKFRKKRNQLENALKVVAQLVPNNLEYIPVFERLEQEIAEIEHQCSVISRASKLSGQVRLSE